MNQFGIQVGLKKKAAFEGWFSKVDDRKNDLMFSVIWGYSTHEGTKHAFLQFQDSLNHHTAYVRYPMEALRWEDPPFVLHIGENTLSEKGMVLDFMSAGRRVKGTFRFEGLTPIRTSFLKPNIMGWLTHFPNECNHSIASMHHRVHGTLEIGTKTFQVEDAEGYMEKDWGRSFPREYVWVHAHDGNEGSLVFSYATVPVLGQHAKGFFLVLQSAGKEYRFSSIEGSRLIQFHVTEDAFEVRIKKGRYQVHLKAKQANPVALASPDQGEMRATIKESLDGTVELLLKEGGAIVAALSSDRASIDVHFHGKKE